MVRLRLTHHVNRGVILDVSLSKKLKKCIGEDYRHLNKKAGQHSVMIKRRINEIAAAENYGDYERIGIGNPHLLDGDLEGCFAVNVSRNYRLIARPCVEAYTAQAAAVCKKVIIEGVVDYHGKRTWLIP